MRVLASTFGQGDLEKTIQAMRSLPYDRLVLIGMPGIEECDDLRRIRQLEEMAGHEVELDVAECGDFMGMVKQVAETLAQRLNGGRGAEKDSLVLNIGGGPKLLGDAALLAAFELGVEAYHIDGRVTKLPIIRGATARDRFTKNQARMLETIAHGAVTLDGLTAELGPMSRQAVDRVVRELRNEGLIGSRVEDGRVLVQLTPPGLEVLRALRLTKAD